MGRIRLLLLAIFFPIMFNSELSYHARIHEINFDNYDLHLIKSGDIIFRRGIGLASDLILSADNTCPYSHVGIIEKTNDGIFVIHSSPADEYKSTNTISKEPLKLFLSKETATDFTVLRIKQKLNLQKVIRFADSIFNNALEFDDDFDLINSDKFYCTELVYKSYLYAGFDLTNGKFDTLLIPIGKNPFLLPGTLLKSDNLKSINLKKGEVHED